MKNGYKIVEDLEAIENEQNQKQYEKLGFHIGEITDLLIIE